MTMISTGNTTNLTRLNLWSAQIKEILRDELMAQNLARPLEGFPDGDTFNIPSWGDLNSMPYSEGDAVVYQNIDTGNFTFTISEYQQANVAISEKWMQDSYLSEQFKAQYPEKAARAIMEDFETKILALVNEQTASNSNTINGAKHRFVASGTNGVLELEDFAKAKYALDKANVPAAGRVAIVDPSVTMALQTKSNLTNLIQPHPSWETVVVGGLARNMRFVTNIFGFDVYESNRLPAAASETIDGVSTNSSGVVNVFMSADTSMDANPFLYAWRQEIKMEYDFNKDLQRHEYVTTARWGKKLYRPEGVVGVLTNTNQVYA